MTTAPACAKPVPALFPDACAAEGAVSNAPRGAKRIAAIDMAGRSPR